MYSTHAAAVCLWRKAREREEHGSAPDARLCDDSQEPRSMWDCDLPVPATPGAVSWSEGAPGTSAQQIAHKLSSHSGHYMRSGGKRRSNQTAYFLKTPKTGGATFMLELLGWSCAYSVEQEFRWAEDGMGLLPTGSSGEGLGLLAREPLAHLISMYNHCQFGVGMQIHHYPRIGLDAWTRAWVDDSPDKARYCSYNPLNFQTANLAGTIAGDRDRETKLKRMQAAPAATLARALKAVSVARFVGVTSRMKESLCVAVFAICALHLSTSAPLPISARTPPPPPTPLITTRQTAPCRRMVAARARSRVRCGTSRTASTTVRWTGTR